MKLAFVAAALAALSLSIVSVRAAPLAPLGAAAQPDVVLVAQGCGIGWHRGPSWRLPPQPQPVLALLVRARPLRRLAPGSATRRAAALAPGSRAATESRRAGFAVREKTHPRPSI